MSTNQPDNSPYFKIGFHTGGFNSAYFSFEKALHWATEHGIHHIECGFLDGVAWNHGLGYFPHVASWEDPVLLRKKMESYHVSFSQIDAAFPISGKEGPLWGVPYILKTISWAAHAGCPMVDTTDGLDKPEGLSDEDAMAQMKQSYCQIMEVAEAYGMIINIETHGYFTSNPKRMEEMLNFCDSPLLKLNMDTGNVFISGQDPVAFLKRFIDKVSHIHIKDVAPKLADSSRGKQHGIGMSHCAVGDGVNAENIRQSFILLKEHGFQGNISIECEAAGGPMLKKSMQWVFQTLQELEISHDLETV